MVGEWPGSDCASIAQSFVENHSRQHWTSLFSRLLDFFKSHLRIGCTRNCPWWPQLSAKEDLVLHGSSKTEYTQRAMHTNMQSKLEQAEIRKGAHETT